VIINFKNMLNKIYKISLISLFITLPIFASAQLHLTESLLGNAKNIVTNTLVPLVFILALLFFFWGVARYIWSAGSSDKDEGKKIMFWGVVALFVMSSVWGIIAFIQGELKIPKGTTGTIPTIE